MYPFYKSYIKIYKGKLFAKANDNIQNRPSKVIVLDLDETIGSFNELFILWKWILSKEYVFENGEQMFFNDLLDLYPEFLRYGILNILEYLYYKKSIDDCSKIYLYTNNQCSPNAKWINIIIKYLEFRLGINDLFDQMICSFKIDNRIVELKRTTQQKTYSDLIKCTLLPKTTEICFIDNSYYQKMMNDRVYYIQPKSYFHSLNVGEIIDRFICSQLFVKGTSIELYDWFSKHHTNKNRDAEKDDIIVSQKLMYHLKDFFILTTKKQKTRKVAMNIGRFTRKRRL